MRDKLLEELLSLTESEKLTVLAMLCSPKDVFPIDESEGGSYSYFADVSS